MTKAILTVLLLISHIFNTFAGSFHNISVKDGLSSRQVFQINKDSAGFVWIFTHLGVDRYDGNEIRHYKLNETLEAKDHILSSTIMTCDKTGVIWISLKNGELYSYDKETDTFILQADITQILSAPVILNDIMFDRDNCLWICLSTGIYFFDTVSKQLTFAALANEYVNRIIQAKDGVFYAGTNTHVFQLQKKVGEKFFPTAKRLPFPIEVRTESLCSFQQTLYIGTFSNGMFMIDIPTGKVISFDDYIPQVPIRTIIPINGNTILVGTDGSGIYILDASKRKVINKYSANEDDTRSISGNTVYDMMVDERNCIWVSTYTNGISILDPQYPDIRWIKHGHNNKNSLASSHINVMLEDSEGDLWYGTNNGISLYQPRKDKWTHYLNEKGGDANYPSVVLALCEDSRKNIWAGGYGVGVFCINKQTGQIQKMKTQVQDAPKGMSTDYIYSILSDEDYIWLGGIEGDFTRYNIKTQEFTYYPIDCIGDIKAGKNNTLYIAGCDGLAIFDKTNGNTTWHQTFGDITLRYPIRCLLHASTGDIWLATDGEGLIRFNPETNDSKFFTIDDGIISNAINNILEDDAGIIWFNTEKSLYCLDNNTRKIISMNEFLDIDWGHYNANACIKLKNGDLVFGTADGAISFSPHFNFEKENPIQLIFTDLKLLYQSVQAGIEGSLLKRAINETSSVKLKYEQNSFSLSFSAINFVHPHKVNFEYKLENFSNDWQQAGSIHNVNFMNLSPGKYIFRLKAIDKYTQKELGERSLEIIIGKPFWASYWAFFIYFIVICVLVLLIIQFGRHKITEYNSKEKIRAFINIAHDIRTPITLINAPLSELEMQEGLPEQSKKSLAIAKKNAEKLFAMVTQLLDLQKLDLQAKKLNVDEQDIHTYMQEKITDFRMAAIQKGIDLSLEIQPGFPKVWFDKSKMNKIVNNLLSNALKYTQEGSVHVIVTHFKKKWSIKIQDTGIGIPANDQKHLFNEFYRAGNAINSDETGSGIGLLLSRRIVKQHHGHISFSSTEDKGSTFVVTFPQKIKSTTIANIQPKEEPAPANQELQVYRPTGKNVLLLAEDDDDMREYLTHSLSEEYLVISVTDGSKALEKAREINPDIIISDILMPVMQGDEMCRILKSSIETSHIPIILLTALSEKENVILGLEAGANDYIIKPFDFSILKVRIRNVLQNRELLRKTVLSSETHLEEIDYTSQLDKEFLEKAMQIIEEELDNTEFSINDFCRILGMSRTSVYNKIKNLTDQSPNDFIRIIRLNKAMELLKSRKFTISEVSSMVGFSDPKYFSTCYKKQFGISPSKV